MICLLVCQGISVNLQKNRLNLRGARIGRQEGETVKTKKSVEVKEFVKQYLGLRIKELERIYGIEHGGNRKTSKSKTLQKILGHANISMTMI